MIAKLRREIALLRHDFWSSQHSGAILIVGFGVIWLVVMVLLI